MSENDRPSCLYCAKPLRLSTRMITNVPKGESPKAYHDRFPSRDEGKPILRITKRSGRQETETLTVWLGDYGGYGWLEGRDAPLFCTLGCGLQMGVAAVRAGWRIKGRKA